MSMMVTTLESTNQVGTFSIGGVMSAPVGCRDIHGRMLARELGDGKEDGAVPRREPRAGMEDSGAGRGKYSTEFRPYCSRRRKTGQVRPPIRCLTSSATAALFCLRQRPGGLSDVFNEKLHSRARGSFFQSHDVRCSSGHGEFQGQDLERGKRCAEMQRGFLDHG